MKRIHALEALLYVDVVVLASSLHDPQLSLQWIPFEDEAAGMRLFQEINSPPERGIHGDGGSGNLLDGRLNLNMLNGRFKSFSKVLNMYDRENTHTHLKETG